MNTSQATASEESVRGKRRTSELVVRAAVGRWFPRVG